MDPKYAPSRGRRRALREADGTPVDATKASNAMMVISEKIPVETYYDASDKLLDAFNQAFDDRKLDDAYVLGIRFATFSIDILPAHSAYQSQKALRLANVQNIRNVLDKVEQVASRMDDEEMAMAKKQLAEEAMQRQKEIEKQKAAEAKERQTEAEQQKPGERAERAMEVEQQKAAAAERAMVMEQHRAAEVQRQNAAERQQATKQVQQSAMAKLAALGGRGKTEADTAKQRAQAEEAARKQKEEEDAKIQAAAQETEKKKQEEVQKQRAFLAITAKEEEKKAEEEEITARSIAVEVDKTSTQSVDDDMKRKLAEAESKATADSRARAALLKGGHSVGTEAERLAREQQIATEEQKAHEAWETYKLFFREAQHEEDQHQDLRRAQEMEDQLFVLEHAQRAQSSTRLTSIMRGDSVSSLGGSRRNINQAENSGNKKQTPKRWLSFKSSEEERTIKLLKKTIEKQQRRLKDLQTKQIPNLLAAAKINMSKGERRAAASCMARKKRLEYEVESTRSSIFNMETLVIDLEAATEDREVTRVIEEANQTIRALQMQAGGKVNPVDDLTRVMNNVSDEVDYNLMLDEDDLLQELNRDTEKENPSSLSLPEEPSTELPLVVAELVREEEENQGIITLT